MAENGRALGVIHLKDVVKEGIRERFDELRAMGIRTVMITGDNPLTAKAIADEAGVDDFLAEATPEDKMALIKREQAGGDLVAMTGDGTNDAPALAQADVGVAMNTGTQAAKEAGNMVDLDSNPTKLIEIVEIGKQLLITRGSLTTFSIANDVAKYFAIIPAMFAGAFPALDSLNIMHLDSPQSAHPLGGHLQRARHRGADPARAARREASGPPPRPRCCAATCSSTALGGVDRAVHRDQADRHRRRRDWGSSDAPPAPPRARSPSWRSRSLLGIVYPLAITGIVAGRLLVARPNGSLVKRDGRVVGSSLIGQSFTATASTSTRARPRRATATTRRRARPRTSGPTNPDLLEGRARARIAAYRRENGLAPARRCRSTR